MARSIPQRSPVKERKSAVRRRDSVDVDQALRAMLASQSASAKKRLYRALKESQATSDVETGDDELDDDEGDEEPDSEEDIQVPPVLSSKLERTLLDASSTTQVDIATKASKELQSIVQSFQSVIITLESEVGVVDCVDNQLEDTNNLRLCLVEEASKLKAGLKAYQTTSHDLWTKLQRAQQEQAAEVFKVQGALAAKCTATLTKELRETVHENQAELQTYHSRLKSVNASYRAKLQKSIDPQTIQKEAHQAVSSALKASGI